MGSVELIKLDDIKPVKTKSGSYATIVSSSYSTLLCSDLHSEASSLGYAYDLFDLRKITNIHYDEILSSVKHTGRLLVVDGGWSSCGLSSEIVASVTEKLSPSIFKSSPSRLTLPSTPAPCSGVLEKLYYPSSAQLLNSLRSLDS